WFGVEVDVFGVDVSRDFTSQGWRSTKYYLVVDQEGNVNTFKQDLLVDDTDGQTFIELMKNALDEGNPQARRELFSYAQKMRDEGIEQAKALQLEIQMG